MPRVKQRAIVYRQGIHASNNRSADARDAERAKSDQHEQCERCGRHILKKANGELIKHYSDVKNKTGCFVFPH